MNSASSCPKKKHWDRDGQFAAALLRPYETDLDGLNLAYAVTHEKPNVGASTLVTNLDGEATIAQFQRVVFVAATAGGTLVGRRGDALGLFGPSCQARWFRLVN
jgi:hypothetical protein